MPSSGWLTLHFKPLRRSGPPDSDGPSDDHPSSYSDGSESDDEPLDRDPFHKALENAVLKYVNNRMPIRLLQLPEMKLIERSAIVRHVLGPVVANIAKEDVVNLTTQAMGTLASWTPKDTVEALIMEKLIEEHARYAILSHTWLGKKPEVLYSDTKDPQKWQSMRTRRGTGYRKLEGFCKVAREQHGVSLAWMDTICINKDSTSELDESIRSMYRWYRDSYICIAYLSETTSLTDMPNDRWFTRGWTLQELLAPARMKFYCTDWRPLTRAADGVDKRNITPPSVLDPGEPLPEILNTIAKSTGIGPRDLITHEPGVTGSGIASRMVWAAKRTTTRGEDRAYSLMGIFNVSFPIAYGEGEQRAFLRLMEAILTSHSNPLDVLNWAGIPISSAIHSSSVLPSGLECYLKHSPQLDWSKFAPSKPMILTHVGLRVGLIVIRAEFISSEQALQELVANGSVKFRCLLSMTLVSPGAVNQWHFMCTSLSSCLAPTVGLI
ncbi:heterokaryon incompatibility protein-domain-containing protein [Flammula alnicola]|nr:heterokaryon incompatibility protein-domain-containing protein [Flammula alnicola]